MYITLDPYYNVNFYNEAKEALKNNDIEFKEFVSIKSPYNWYIQLDQKPIMVNYDESSKEYSRYLISKVIPTRANSEYVLMRRENTGANSLIQYTENEPFTACRLSSSGVAFHVKNRDELLRISREYPKKIWFIGKYLSNRYNICIADDSIIKNYIDPSNILLENTYNEPGRFEAEINYKLFTLKDRIIKYDDVHYALNGSYKIPKVLLDKSNKFNLV